MGYSRLVFWEVWNFMSYSHAKCEFDDRGIITIKGYNDSGKSAMLQALNVLMLNAKPTQQVGFIKDDCDYFRVLASFDDGVVILRDKYINGQSLYEMYKDNQLIFTTKEGNNLTRVVGVPEPIQQYLGLISYENTCLNSRSCIEKQLLVQTTGSENYKLLNVILKSEELAVATEMLNTDKNALLQDINSTEAKLSSAQEMIGVGSKLNDALLKSLENADKTVDAREESINALKSIGVLQDSIQSIQITPELNPIDISQVDLLTSIADIQRGIDNIVVTPNLDLVSTDDIVLLSKIESIYSELSSIKELPQLTITDTERLDDLLSIQDKEATLLNLEKEDRDLDDKLQSLSQELTEYTSALASLGKRVIKCPNCGTVYSEEDGHEDAV